MMERLHLVCPHCRSLNRVPADRLREGPNCGHCHRPLFIGHPLALTAADFELHLTRAEIPLVVDFWAPWCGPCRMMAPAYEQAATQLEPLARLAKVNTEEEQALAARFGISSIPTLIVFRAGREVARQPGAMGTHDIVRWVRAHVCGCQQRDTMVSRWALVVLPVLSVVGCGEMEPRQSEPRPNPYLTSDTRQTIALTPAAGKEHRAVMLQHLETLQAIVNALVEEDYELAQGLTESHLGFFMHRQAMAKQQPEQFPPAYHDLAMAHHEAAEELARVMPTKDLKRILPGFNNVLKACVACHLEYKIDGAR